MSARTPGLLPLSPRVPALEAELARLDAELGHSLHPAWRKLLAIERRRVVLALDRHVRHGGDIARGQDS